MTQMLHTELVCAVGFCTGFSASLRRRYSIKRRCLISGDVSGTRLTSIGCCQRVLLEFQPGFTFWWSPVRGAWWLSVRPRASAARLWRWGTVASLSPLLWWYSFRSLLSIWLTWPCILLVGRSSTSARAHTHTYTYALKHTQTHTHMHTHTHAHTRKHTHTHAATHTKSLTNTQTPTSARILPLPLVTRVLWPELPGLHLALGVASFFPRILRPMRSNPICCWGNFLLCGRNWVEGTERRTAHRRLFLGNRTPARFLTDWSVADAPDASYQFPFLPFRRLGRRQASPIVLPCSTVVWKASKQRF